MKKKITFLALVLALIAAPSYTDVTTKSNLNRALADALYCQLTGCTMAGPFFGSGGVAYIGQEQTYGGAWHSGISVYGDVSATNPLTIYDSRAMAANVGAMITLGGKWKADGSYTDFGAIQAIKTNATEADDSSKLYFQFSPTSGNWGLQWVMDGDGFHPNADLTYNIGASTARPITVYAGGLVAGYVAKTATYTATANDHTIAVTPAAATTIVLPAAASNTGRIYVIRKMDASANAVTIDPSGAETINGAATYVVPNTTAVTIQCTGSAWIIISLT